MKKPKVREPLNLPLQPEERLRVLREKFDNLCRLHEAQALSFLRSRISKLIPYEDDVMADAKMRMWKYWEQHSGGIEYFKSFFCRTIINAGLDLLKKQKGRQTLSLYFENDEGDQQTYEIAQYMPPIEDIRSTALEALDRLPEFYKEILEMIGQEMTYEEIATALDLPVGTVKSRLNRGRRLLLQELEILGLNSDFTYENVRLGSLTEGPEEKATVTPNKYTSQSGSPFKNLGQFAEYFVRAAKAIDGSAVIASTATTVLSVSMCKSEPYLSVRNRERAHRAIELRLKELNRRGDIPEWQKLFDDMTQVPTSKPYVSKKEAKSAEPKEETFYTEGHTPFTTAEIFAKAIAETQGNVEWAELAKMSLDEGFEKKIITRKFRDLVYAAIRQKFQGQDEALATYWIGRFDSYIPDTVGEDPIETPKARVVNAPKPTPPGQNIVFISEEEKTTPKVDSTVAVEETIDPSKNGQPKRRYTRRVREETPETQIPAAAEKAQTVSVPIPLPRKEAPVVPGSHVLRALEKVAGGGIVGKAEMLKELYPFISDATLSSFLNDCLEDEVNRRVEERLAAFTSELAT